MRCSTHTRRTPYSAPKATVASRMVASATLGGGYRWGYITGFLFVETCVGVGLEISDWEMTAANRALRGGHLFYFLRIIFRIRFHLIFSASRIYLVHSSTAPLCNRVVDLFGATSSSCTSEGKLTARDEDDRRPGSPGDGLLHRHPSGRRVEHSAEYTCSDVRTTSATPGRAPKKSSNFVFTP